MGGGSARMTDGSYKSGDGWGWSAQKPFQTPEGSTQPNPADEFTYR